MLRRRNRLRQRQDRRGNGSMTITSRDSLATSRVSARIVGKSVTCPRSAVSYTMSRITFASCYVYSPCGSGAACERSRLLRAMLKSSDTHFIVQYAFRVRQQVVEESPLAGFVCPDQVLVPVPASARSTAGTMTVAENLATAMAAAGLGGGIWNGLRRVRPGSKSAK